MIDPARRQRLSAARLGLLSAMAIVLVGVGALVARHLLDPAPSAVVTRWVHLEAAPGISFDYPDGWIVAHPNDVSTMDRALVTVSSAPLLPPCSDLSRCQRFTTPRAAIVVEFRTGAGPGTPDWSRASTTLGGQPATHQVWGSVNATGAEEGQQWDARLGRRMELGVYVSLRGPGLPALESLMAQVLARIRIDPAALPPEWRD